MDQHSNRNGLFLSPGWKAGEPFIAQGDNTSVAAGAGIAGAARASLLTKTVAPASRVYLQYMGVRIVDMAGYDQIYIALLRNGATLNPWEKINGEQFVDEHIIEIGQEFEPGTFELAATNISGTSEAGASAQPGAIRVLARLVGFTLIQSR